MRLAYVCAPNIGPYHIARFTAAAGAGLELALILLPVREYHRPWVSEKASSGLDVVDLSGLPNGAAGVESALDGNLQALQPHAIAVTGYALSSFRAAARWAKRHGVPSVLLSDSTRNDRRRFWARERMKRLLVARIFDAAFVSGLRAEAYVCSLGIPEDAVWRGVDVVDNEWFARACRRRSSVGRSASGRMPHFLSVTRLSPEKNLGMLIESYRLYRHSGGRWDLHIVGTGPDEADLKQSVPATISQHVRWVGWKQYEDMPDVYAEASCFVLASRSETWGLVVNEAMAAGLPVLLSRTCGCVPELCWRGINGYDFAPTNPGELARLFERMSSGQVDRNAMGEASRRIIANFTPHTWACALRDCIQTTAERMRRNRIP